MDRGSCGSRPAQARAGREEAERARGKRREAAGAATASESSPRKRTKLGKKAKTKADRAAQRQEVSGRGSGSASDGVDVGAYVEVLQGKHAGVRGMVLEGYQGYWTIQLEKLADSSAAPKDMPPLTGLRRMQLQVLEGAPSKGAAPGKTAPSTAPGGTSGSATLSSKGAGQKGPPPSRSDKSTSKKGSSSSAMPPPPPPPVYQLNPNARPKKLAKGEFEELTQSRDSVLADAPLVPFVIGWPIFEQLSREEQHELAKHLPECDRTPEMWKSALGAEQLRQGVEEWQRQLSVGEFDPDAMQILSARREKVLRRQRGDATAHVQMEKLQAALAAQGSAAALAFSQDVRTAAENEHAHAAAEASKVLARSGGRASRSMAGLSPAAAAAAAGVAAAPDAAAAAVAAAAAAVAAAAAAVSSNDSADSAATDAPPSVATLVPPSASSDAVNAADEGGASEGDAHHDAHLTRRFSPLRGWALIASDDL